MLMVISPAKTLDFEKPSATKIYSQPVFLKESRQLVKQLKRLAPAEISSLMKISDKLGSLNALRFEQWGTPFTLCNAKQALLAFRGHVYSGINADSFSDLDFEFAQRYLRILSGLYGVLKPLDLIQPYRLEMGTVLENRQGKDLYDFWGTKITKQINLHFKHSKSDVLLNLASNEYFKSLQVDAIKARIITPLFKDLKHGRYKIISFYAKKARGLMSTYIIKHRLKAVEEIKAFRLAGYEFYAADSDAEHWVFQRKQ